MNRFAVAFAFALVGSLALLGCEERDSLVAGTDLRVTNVEFPDVPGFANNSTIEFDVSVKNFGVDAVPTAFGVRVEFFGDNAYSQKLTTMTDLALPAIAGLSSGQATHVEGSTTISVATIPTVIFCRIAVDAVDAVAESDESNNWEFVAFQVLGTGPVTPGDHPDLVVDAIAVDAEVVRGELFDVTVTVRNAGAAAAAVSDLELVGYEDASHTVVLWEVQSKSVGSLASGASADIDFQIQGDNADPLGTAYLVAEADSSTEVTEGSESNNTREQTTTVSLSPLPDLYVVSISAPNEIQQTDTQTINVTIGNAGGGAATPVSPATMFCVTFGAYTDSAGTTLLPGHPPINWELNTLASMAEASHAFGFSAVTSDPLGTIYFIARVDAYAVVPEADESHNTGTAASQIIPKHRPDLIVSITSCTGTHNISDTGARVTVVYTVTNAGTKFSEGTFANAVIRRRDTGAVVETFELDGVDILAVNESKEFTEVLDPNGALPYDIGDQHDLVVVVDPTNVVEESDEGNNVSLPAASVFVY